MKTSITFGQAYQVNSKVYNRKEERKKPKRLLSGNVEMRAGGGEVKESCVGAASGCAGGCFAID